jgi:hypothetical protein
VEVFLGFIQLLRVNVVGFPGGAFAQQPQPTTNPVVNPLGMALANGFPPPVPQQVPPVQQPQGYSQSLIDQMKKLGMNAPAAPPTFGYPGPGLGVQPQQVLVQPQAQFAPPVVGMPWGTSTIPPSSGPASFPFGNVMSTPANPGPAQSYGQTTSKNLWQ